MQNFFYVSGHFYTLLRTAEHEIIIFKKKMFPELQNIHNKRNYADDNNQNQIHNAH